jgi:cobalt-zinc-cadmium efflux system membrane fusion protein
VRIRRARRPKGTTPWILSFLLLSLPLAACHKASPEAVDTVEAVPVTVATARSGSIRAVIAATGQVKPAPGAELLVAAPQEARIAELPKALGDRVRRGELLARFEIPTLQADAAARHSDLARAEAQLAAARQNATRLSGLFQRGIAARREVEDAQRDLTQAEATVTEARSATSAAGSLAGRQVVRAPFDGVVVSRSHQAGDLVDPSAPEPLLRVIDPSRLQVEAAVPAGSLGPIAMGAPARVRGANFPVQAARVVAQPAAVDPMTGTALVRLAFAGTTRLPSGLAVEVEIDGEEHLAAVLVPAEALVQEGAASYVYAVDGQKKAHRRQVRVGVTAGGQAEILSGITAGEPVVVRGQTALPDGALVETAEAAGTTEPAP